MPKTESPLRYPGGKTKLYSLIQPIIANNLCGDDRIYVEPFAGGSGLALQLLYNDDVDRLVLNDIDRSIYAFWNVCLNNAEELCALIENCRISMETWEVEKEIYENPEGRTAVEVAFATFFLNRCNVSGIIRGGPIGGHNQTGNYGIDARFNRADLIRKIMRVYENRTQISFYNLDAIDFVRETLQPYGTNILLNIDPPYVKKGPMLYENSFTEENHRRLARIIHRLPYKWIVTYDECELIYDLYSLYRKEIITLNYSTGNTKNGRELMIYSEEVDLDIEEVVQ